MRWIRGACIGAVLALVACGGGALPSVGPQSSFGGGVVDTSANGCVVSYDGQIWYSVPAGAFSPIDIRAAKCNAATLGHKASAPIPRWAVPSGATKAIFVATSLQQGYSPQGMEMLEADASPAHVPITWMIGNEAYFANAPLYNQYHARNGDDVETGEIGPPIAVMQANFPWYVPHVSVDGGGRERFPSVDIAAGFDGFWGITWDSQGIDGTSDTGAPWGEYCADPTSYKRPDPSGNCAFIAYEWTARDLTRAYLSRLDYWFSTDPDDILLRAGFDPVSGAQYEREIIDAYAAAGQTQPLVVMSQQESDEEAANPDDDTLMTALYQEVAKVGMKLDTFATVNADAQTFGAAPRAVAFPYLIGGTTVPSTILNGGTLYPATIDYHDTAVGMTFLAGHTTPTRVFEYPADPHSAYDVPLAELSTTQTPALTSVSVMNGSISFAFTAPVAVRYGVALWADPSQLHIAGGGATAAGHAGVVFAFMLQAGANTMTFACPGCTGTAFTYAT